MSGRALEVSVELTQMSCSCGGVYAINERVREHHEKHGSSWTCPYCKTGWGYAGGIVKQKEKELADEKARHARTLERLNTLAKERRTLEAKLARVCGGVCPECNRTFRDLARHMRCKHVKGVEGDVGATPLP